MSNRYLLKKNFLKLVKVFLYKVIGKDAQVKILLSQGTSYKYKGGQRLVNLYNMK